MAGLNPDALLQAHAHRENIGTVFFLGAGASVAAGVPDTRSFIDSFREILKSEPDVLAEADELLRVLGGSDRATDVESLLEALDYLDPVTRSQIPAFAVAAPKYEFSKTSAAQLRKTRTRGRGR